MISLHHAISRQDDHPDHLILARDEDGSLSLGEVSSVPDGPDLSDTGVAITSRNPMFVLRQILLLDGRVGRMLLLAPSLSPSTVSQLMRQAGCDILVSDREDLAGVQSFGASRSRDIETKWLLTTSGTTGVPKIVEHSLATVTASTKTNTQNVGSGAKWGLLYELSRFAGVQVALQSMLGGGLLLAPRQTSLSGRLEFLIREGCTHLSATPTLWRKCLMLPEFDGLDLKQITIGGEIADDQLLKALRQKQPRARITHIYASTEIGVGFPVNDGRAGFPTSYLDGVSQARLKVVDGVLWAKPTDARASIAAAHIKRDDEGFINTGDRVQIVDDRVFFLGRESSLVNVGGVKIQIEDVETVVRGCPEIADCYLEAKKNSFSGAVLVLTVSLRDPGIGETEGKRVVREWCKSQLPREAQPATIKVVDAIDISSSGKLSRARVE